MLASAAKQNKSHDVFASCVGHISSSSVYDLVLLCVEHIFVLLWYMCPFIMPVDVGRCLLTASKVSPGTFASFVFSNKFSIGSLRSHGFQSRSLVASISVGLILPYSF